MGKVPAAAEVQVIPLLGTLPRLVVLPRDPQPWTPAHEAAWAAMLDANERLHDGPIWSVVRATRDAVEVRPDQYRRLSVQTDPAAGGVGDLGVRQLGVKGLTVGLGRDGQPRLLLARRGTSTRIYPGLWEIAPAGGVDVKRRLSPDALVDAVVQEAAEELGIDLTAGPLRVSPVCLVADPIARSVDVVMELPWPGRINEKRGFCLAPGADCAWEYLDGAWLTREECAGFAAQNPGALSPPTAAVLRWMGWAV